MKNDLGTCQGSYQCFMIEFCLANGTWQKWSGIYDSVEQANAMIRNPIREHIAPSTVYRVVPAVWPDDWR